MADGAAQCSGGRRRVVARRFNGGRRRVVARRFNGGRRRVVARRFNGGRQMTFRSLDFIYMPSANVEKDLKYYVRAIGAEPVFSIKAFGTRVAALRVGDGPMLLLAGHLE